MDESKNISSNITPSAIYNVNTSHDDSSFEVVASDNHHYTNHEDWSMVDDQHQQQQQHPTSQAFLHADIKGLTLVNNSQTLTSEFARDVDRWKNTTMPCLAQFSQLSSLRVLDLYKNRYITHLHPSICDLVQLQVLSLKRCEQLTTLPDAIGNLKQLVTLDLTDASNLSSLPDSIGELSRYVCLLLRVFCAVQYFFWMCHFVIWCSHGKMFMLSIDSLLF
jgi:hypothetical protein